MSCNLLCALLLFFFFFSSRRRHTRCSRDWSSDVCSSDLEPVHFQPRYRGIHVLHRDENGLEKCVGCFLCAAACPANCIYIEAAENTDANRISAGERYAAVYNKIGRASCRERV